MSYVGGGRDESQPAHLSPRLSALPLQQDLELVDEGRNPIRLVAPAALKSIPSLGHRRRRGDRHIRLGGTGGRSGAGNEGHKRRSPVWVACYMPLSLAKSGGGKNSSKNKHVHCSQQGKGWGGGLMTQKVVTETAQKTRKKKEKRKNS